MEEFFLTASKQNSRKGRNLQAKPDSRLDCECEEKHQQNAAQMLHVLQKCKTFSELELICSEMECDLYNGKDRFIIDDNLEVDEKAIDLFPDDVPCEKNYFPVKVKADKRLFASKWKCICIWKR
jgi:hypothetical protein